MVGFQKAELPGGQILCGDYIRVEAEIFVVGVLVASVPLVAHGFNCEVGVVNFVYKVQNAQGREGDYDKNNCGEDGSDNFNFLGV